MVRSRKEKEKAQARGSSAPPSSKRRTLPPASLPADLALEQMPVAAAITDGEHLLWVNAATCALLGYRDRGDLVGLPLTEVVVSRDGRAERWLRGDGTAMGVEVARAKLDGTTLLVLRDASRGEAAAVEVLADRLAPAGALAAGLAHQINNPLAYVLANLTFLSEEIPQLVEAARTGALGEQQLAAEQNELLRCVDDARHGAERVAAIVRDLKMLSRMDDDRVTDVDVLAVLEAAYNVVHAQLHARARVIMDFHEVPRVRANEARLAQVFVDLLLNAAHAIPEGESDQHDVRVVAATDDTGWASISITDDGVGIAPELFPRIFDPFFSTRPFDGRAGLGLTVCHGIVAAIGGRIQAESELGRGSTFRVVLPPSGTKHTSAVAPSPARAASKGPLRILVVDDEPQLGKALARALGEHDVTTTTSSRDALERLLGGESFDAVLCDVVMPEPNGIELYRRVRAQRPDQAARFVFMTGGAFTHKTKEFLESTPNLQLPKPFVRAKLEDVLDRVRSIQ